MNAAGIDVSKGKSMMAALQNNLISLTDKTFPGVTELFPSPDRTDGSRKWIDFVTTFWHCECICLVHEMAFTACCRFDAVSGKIFRKDTRWSL